MKRGDVWTTSGGNNYARKHQPVVIVQDDSFDSTASITVCAFTAAWHSGGGEKALTALWLLPMTRMPWRAATLSMMKAIVVPLSVSEHGLVQSAASSA